MNNCLEIEYMDFDMGTGKGFHNDLFNSTPFEIIETCGNPGNGQLRQAKSFHVASQGLKGFS